MTKYIKILILIILMIIVVSFGFLIYKKSKTKSEENPPIINNVENSFEHNNNDAIYKEHCLNDLCVDINSMNYGLDLGGIGLNIKNKGNNTNAAGFVNIIFITDNNTYKLFFYHDDILPNSTINTEIQFLEKNIINTANYYLENPSEEELKEYNANLFID